MPVGRFEYRFSCDQKIADKMTKRMAELNLDRTAIFVGFIEEFLELVKDETPDDIAEEFQKV